MTPVYLKNTKDCVIFLRGSMTDVATDIAYLIDAEQAKILIDELQRFIDHCPEKFQSKAIDK